jgi:hypothetical protein
VSYTDREGDSGAPGLPSREAQSVINFIAVTQQKIRTQQIKNKTADCADFTEKGNAPHA